MFVSTFRFEISVLIAILLATVSPTKSIPLGPGRQQVVGPTSLLSIAERTSPFPVDNSVYQNTRYASGLSPVEDLSSFFTLREKLGEIEEFEERKHSDHLAMVKGMMVRNFEGEEVFNDEPDNEDGGSIITDKEILESSSQKSNPFSVQIEAQRFFGGLVTYSHAHHPAQICRVMNACLRSDGTLVLPAWMRRHDKTLSFHCGYLKLEFTLHDTAPPPALIQADLVGLGQPRPSIPDFIHDFVPNAVVFDLVYGDHEVLKSCHSRKGKDCDSFPSLTQDFRPAVFLHPRLQSLQEKKSWVRQFVKLMKPPNTGKQAEMIYDNRPSDSEQDLKCFRSAFFTRGPYNKNSIMEDHLRSIHFLDLNGIRKKARKVSRIYLQNGKEKTTCALNITLSNRKVVDGARDRLIGRYIRNIPELKVAIMKQAKRIPGLKLNIESMTLEGRTLRWQINGMQKTDVWVAGHGPLLTNMLFLRENSTLVEVQPFAYYPQTYENMARFLAHVKYDRYIAHPDIEAFDKCMRSMYPKKHPMFHKASEVLEKFSKAAAKYKQSDSTHSLTLQNFNDTKLRYVKNCAEMQRLDTNAMHLAVAVVRHARLRCGLPKPSLKTVET